ncbi:MAG: exodeoxyribonuclease V subunit alpha [Lentisphaerae bacterium]|nr:exodeoxyribonuclease V subunit alpha [Lentisphaerota bacterium]
MTSLKTIKSLLKIAFLKPIDLQMADLVRRAYPDAHQDLILLAALTTKAINDGHVCLDLKQYANKTWLEILQEKHITATEPDLELHSSLPTLEDWITLLPTHIVADSFANITESEKPTLFIRKNTKIYLRRYWDYETNTQIKLRNLNRSSGIKADEQVLNSYFKDNDQREAAKKIIEKKLCLVTGGPGTGKTYTLAKAVALLAQIKLITDTDKTLIVKMVAPTGQAAVRMATSIINAKNAQRQQGVPEESLRLIPESASTIHRLLGSQFNSPYFVHDAKNPIVADMVIVDESSMVDLPLMSKLLDALPDECSLVLVGDTNQLASVEPGRVFKDICSSAAPGKPLERCLANLSTSRRFPAESIIGKLSNLINEGNADSAWTLMKSDNREVKQVSCSELLANSQLLETLVRKHLADFMSQKEPDAVLNAAGNFRILAALRNGPYGVVRLNREVERILGLPVGKQFYDHQLIMINKNTPALNLYNGDIGVILAVDPEGGTNLTAWFIGNDKEPRPFPISLLPEHETAFAMTIHKSQGSEFPYVAIVLPNEDTSPILSRELLYTGVTRVKLDVKNANDNLYLWCSRASFRKAVLTVSERATGLFDNLDDYPKFKSWQVQTSYLPGLS